MHKYCAHEKHFSRKAMNNTKTLAWRTEGFLLLLASILFVTGPVSAAAQGQQGPPPKVVVAPVESQDIVPATEYVGHVEALQAVDIRARVEGFIEDVKFKEGDTVTEGSVLYALEQDRYKAQFAADEAKINQDEAEVTRSEQHLRRLQAALPESVSASDLDNAVAAVTDAKAKLAESMANLTQSRLNLDYTTIQAPITGRIGRTMYTRGNLVSTASGPLARIVQVDPVRVVYSISENDIPALQAAMTDAENKDNNRLLSPQLRLADGSDYTGNGHVDFVDNEVDQATGTVAVRALFDNKDGNLLPGQYVTVLVKLSEPKVMPVIPQAAVMTSQEGNSVLVVDAENKVAPRPITLGPAVGTMWAVASGLNPGETIIVQGIQKVRPGQVVEPVKATGEGN